MTNLTFNDLPEAIASLQQSIEDIKKLLLQQTSLPPPNEDIPITVKEVARFLSLSVPTIYSLISTGSLPVVKRSKRCYFFKSDLILYLKAGRKKTHAELESEADAFISRSRRKQ